MACAPQASSFLGTKVRNGTHVGFVDDSDRHVDLEDKDKYSGYSSTNSSSESNEQINDNSTNLINEKPTNGLLSLPSKFSKKASNVQFEDFKRPKVTKSLKKLVRLSWNEIVNGMTFIIAGH